MPQVQMPDGQVVDMPDKLDPETASRLHSFIQSKSDPSQGLSGGESYIASNTPPATRQQLQTDILYPPSTYQRAVNAFAKSPGDIASFPGMVVDTISNSAAIPANYLGEKLANAVGHPEWAYPVPQMNLAQTIREPIDQLTGTREMIRPQDRLTQYIESGSRLGGNMLVPSGGVISKAEKPVKAAYQEILSALGMTAGQVEGGKIGAQYGNEGVGNVVGGLAGGLWGVKPPLQFIAEQKPIQNLVGKVKGYFASPDQKIDLAKTAVGSELRKYLGDSPEYATNITEAQNTGIPSFQPNLAQASGAPGILGLQHHLEQQDPAFQAQSWVNYKNNQKAVNELESQSFPKTNPDLNLTPKSGVDIAFEAQKVQVQSRLQDVNQQIDTLAQNYQRQPTAQIGSRLRDLRDEQMNLVRIQKDQKYELAKQTGKEVGATSDTSDLVGFVKDTIKAEPNRFQGPNMPGIFDQILSKFGKKEPGQVGLEELTIPESAGAVVNPTQTSKTMSFDELLSLRKRANQEWNASRAGTDYDRTRYLGQLKDMINQKVDAFKDPKYGDLAQQLSEADQFYNQAYRIPFREGAGGRMPYSNRFGEVTPDEQIVSKLLFTPGTKKGVDDFYSMYGDHPEANSLLKKGILDVFADKVVKQSKFGGQQISPTAVDKFFNDYKETFADPRLSGIEGELRNTEGMAKLLQQRRLQIIQERSDLARSTLAKIAKVPAEGIPALMDKAISSPMKLDTLVTSAKTLETQQALSRGVADALLRQSSPYTFLMENQKVLEPALNRLNPGHFNNLKKIAQGQMILDRAPPVQSIEMGKLQDPLQEATGVTSQGAISLGLNIAKGYMSEPYAAAHVAMKKFLQISERERKQVLEQALNDPKLAKDLAAILGGNKTPELKNNVINHLYSLGIRSIGTQNSYPSQPIKEGSQVDPSYFQQDNSKYLPQGAP